MSGSGDSVNAESPAANARCSSTKREDLDDQTQTVDNSATVLAKIAAIYADRLLSDITLVVGNRNWHAHRLILCASSDVFQVMLMSPRWNESRETRVILQEVPACAAIFGDFLEYLYTGKINIGFRNVLPHLMLADKYNVKDLAPLCLNYICQSVSSAADHQQLMSWLQYLTHSGHSVAAEACNRFVCWNFEKVSCAEDFANLDADTLEELLKSSDLVVRDELALFRAVSCWLCSPRDVRGDVFDDASAMRVLEQMRFAMMSPRQLATLLLSPLIVRYVEFFMVRMAAAMTFHCGSSAAAREWLGLPGWLTPEGVAASEAFQNGIMIEPRLYTAETWCAKLGIDNYRDFPEHGVRTLMFSIPEGLKDPNMQRPLEWSVDLYPKGVMFPKCMLIKSYGILEVAEASFRTVRLSVMLRTKDVTEIRVRIAALVTGVVNGVEHVMAVAQRRFVFTPDEAMVNINDVVPYDELNFPDSAFLIGEDRNSLEVHVIITPEAHGFR